MQRSSFVTLLVLAAFLLPLLLYFRDGPALYAVPGAQTFRSMPFADQVVVVITAFVIKPLYMLLSLILAWTLRRTRARDLIALRWGALAFFSGEAFCALNYLAFRDQAYPVEYLHSFGMLVAFGFTGYALLHGLDTRLFHYSDPGKRCSLSGLCGGCIKNQAVPCRGRDFFQLTAVVLAVLTLLPLSSNPGETIYATSILGTSYTYTWLSAEQTFEIRYSPLLALALFISAVAIVRRHKDGLIPEPAKICLCAGIGALGFGLLRLVLGTLYTENLARASSWEEITEFLFMVFIVYVVYQYRSRLEIRLDRIGA